MCLELCLFNIIFIRSQLVWIFCVYLLTNLQLVSVLQNVTCPTTSFTDLAEIVSRIEPVKAPLADGEWGWGGRRNSWDGHCQPQGQAIPCWALPAMGPFPAEHCQSWGHSLLGTDPLCPPPDTPLGQGDQSG